VAQIVEAQSLRQRDELVMLGKVAFGLYDATQRR